MSNMGKGAGYYLTRSKSLLIDTAIVAILAIFMSFAMQMDALQSKGEDYLVLMLYAVIFGLTSLQSGAMIVDLTAKDKLSRRVEFFAASGILSNSRQFTVKVSGSGRLYKLPPGAGFGKSRRINHLYSGWRRLQT